MSLLGTLPRKLVRQYVRVKCLAFERCGGYTSRGPYCHGCEAAISATVQRELVPLSNPLARG